tara:strand:+ start:627 stop:1295 length:669 start_codon:yes stop_codon:yes gene_type:complete
MKENEILIIIGVFLFFANKIFTITSKIPIKSYYNNINILPEAITIKNNFNVFRDEIKDLYKNFKTIKNDMYFNDITKYEWEWSRLYLKWFNHDDKIGMNLCPNSYKLINSMKNIKIAMFSVLKPHAKILPHRGPYKGCIRLHMGLITPNSDDCFINLDGKNYSWRDGEVILLDDSYIHYVENNTDEYRVILFCDIIRPMNNIGNLVNNFFIDNLAKYTERGN